MSASGRSSPPPATAPIDASGPDPRLAAAIAGDRDALESIAAEILPVVRNAVRYLVRGDGDVDDLAQEALVAILRDLPSHRGEGSLRAWASRVTAHLTIKHLVRTRRNHARVDASADLASVPDRLQADDYASRRLAVHLLDQLPDDQRQALVMRHVLGFSVEEIAEETGIPFETVRSRLRLGMAKLRSLCALV
jgi:RNA polymerase sigma-70 factor (ECF subfamily)